MRLLGFLLLLLTSCLDSKKSSMKTFTYNQSLGINSLDPIYSKDQAMMWACSHVYETLYELDSIGQLSPLLAVSYNISLDRLQYTFKIKNNVFFHRDSCFGFDTQRKLSAYDIKYSLSRLLDSSLASPGAWTLMGKLDSINPILVIDSFTLRIHLKKPCSHLLQILSMPYCSIVSKEAVEYYGDKFRSHPVGTGAFQFKLWDDGIALILKKNQDYHIKDHNGEALPRLDYVKITFNELKKSEWFLLKQGKINFINNPDKTLLTELFDKKGNLSYENSREFYASRRDFMQTEYLAFNLTDKSSPLSQKNIRLAIASALNLNEIRFHYKQNLSTLPSGFIPTGMVSKPIFIKQRINDSKTLLKEYGYDKANPLKIELAINNSMSELGELICSQLANSNILCKLKVYPTERINALASEGKLSFFRRSWIADYGDAENFMSCFYSKNPSPPNYTRFHNPRFDFYYELCLVEQDLLKKQFYYAKMEEILVEEAPVIPLFYENSIRIIPKNVHGLEQNPFNLLNLKFVNISTLTN